MRATCRHSAARGGAWVPKDGSIRSSNHPGFTVALCLAALVCAGRPAFGQSASDGPTSGAGDETQASSGESADGAENAQSDDDNLGDLDAMQGAGEVVLLVGEAPYTGEPQSYGLSADEASNLPGTGNDPLKALQSMPGVARVPFGIGGLALRGFSPRDSNIYLDDIEIPLAFHFGGLSSVYPARMLASLDVVPGSFGAAYGRAQGGIVRMRTRPGRGDRWRVGSNVSVIDASAYAEGPDPWGGVWTLGFRRSYIDAILALALPAETNIDLTLAPRYYDGQLRYDREISSNERVSVTFLGSDDRLRFLREDLSVGYQASFARLGARWHRRSGSWLVRVSPWIGVDRVHLSQREDRVTRSGVPMGGRASIHRDLGTDGHISAGVDLQGGRFAFDIESGQSPGPDGQPVGPRSGSGWQLDSALWVEGFYKLEGGRLGVRPGLRLERYGLSGEVVVDPRLVVSHDLPAGVRLRESLGVYHQGPQWVDVDPALGDVGLGPSYSVQASVSVELDITEWLAEKPGFSLDVSITGFHDELYDQLVEIPSQQPGMDDPQSAGFGQQSGGFISIGRELAEEQLGRTVVRDNVGHGRNRGLEFLVRAGGSRWLAWLAYTYTDTARREHPGQFFGYHPYILDQPHAVTALASVQVDEAWRLGARLRYVSGNPYTPVAGTVTDPETAEVRPVDGPLLSARLPAFVQADVRLDRTWRGSFGTLKAFLDIQNVSNRRNPEGVNYNDDFTELGYTTGLPIIPSLGFEYAY